MFQYQKSISSYYPGSNEFLIRMKVLKNKVVNYLHEL